MSTPAILYIRRNADGLVRRDDAEHDFDDDEFLWSEGNFACDCNRALFFAEAAGEDDPDLECGCGAFSVRITDKNGGVLYQDDDWESA